MSTRPIVIAGAGHWHAPRYLEALVRGRARVAAVTDRDDAVASRVAHERRCRWYSAWPDLLDAHPDAVVLVLSVPADAPPLLAELVARRQPFALEKPGTVDASQLAPIAEAARQAGVATAVPFVNRYSPFWSTIRDLGGPSGWAHASFRIIGGPPSRYVDDGVAWALEPARSGGGALRNLGIHAADAVAMLTDPDSVGVLGARTTSRLHGLAVEDHAMAYLNTAHGQTITIEAGSAAPHEAGSDKEWRILSRDWSVVERGGQLLTTTPSGVRFSPTDGVMSHYQRFANDLIRLSAGMPPVADLDDLVAAQRLVDRLYSAAVREV